jgi:hypothetical protein
MRGALFQSTPFGYGDGFISHFVLPVLDFSDFSD